jgi:spore germination protein KB
LSKEVISDIQAICLIILFISGGALALPTGAAAGSDLWLAILMALILAIPLYMVYARLLSLYPGKDLFDILEDIFGRFFGKALGLIFIWFTFHLGVLVLRDQGEFLITLSLPETPMIVPIILVTLLCIWIVKAGMETMGRWANLFVILDAPIPTIVILMLIPQMDLSNIQPVLYDGIRSFLKGTLEALVFPFGDVVVFLMIFFALKPRDSKKSIFIKGLLWGGLLIAGVSLAEILVLGEDLYLSTYYPNHNVAGKVSIGELLQRLEVIAVVATLTSFFLKVSVCLLAVSNGMSKIFGFKDYKILATPIALLMCNFSCFIFDSTIYKFRWLMETTTYYFLPYQIILPIIILIFAQIKKRNNGRSVKKENKSV